MKLEIPHIKQYRNIFNKSLFKILSLSFFLSNFPVLSNANSIVSEIPDRYEILEGEFIGIEDSEENIIKNIEILGNTIQDENNLEDIQSVGDLYIDENGDPILDEQGREQYKIDIISTGENLFNGILEQGFINADTGEEYTHNNEFIRTKNFINVIPNKQLFINNSGLKNCGFIMFYDKNKNFISSQYIENSKNASTPSNCYYVKLRWHNYGGIEPSDIYDVMLSYTKEEYKPYQESKLTILSPTPLEKVGGITDKIICKNGVWGIEKNVTTRIFDGSENFYRGDSSLELQNTLLFHIDVDTINETKAICDSFIWEHSLNDYEHIWVGNNNFGVHILKSKLSTQDVNGFKAWLQINPVLVKYQTAKPQFIPLPNSQQIKINTFLNKTHIFSETEAGVNPTLKIAVDRINKLSREAVEKAENEPIIDNISIARMWVNQMDECILKDQLNERINQIYGIADLELEKKDITNNIDIYIKPQNILSMNLSTNNISFEDFNNTEDLEYLNAVEVTVNSSLPYQLNAYLESEIQNADKTKYINKSILNIKSSSKNEYRSFVDLVTPIVIEDDQEAGENNIHSIDIKLSGSSSYEVDVYKTTIKFEAKQK